MGRLSSLTLLQGAEGRGTMPLLARGHPPPALPHRKTRLGTLILTLPPISPSPPPHTHTTIAHAVITSYFHNNILSSHRIFRTRNSSVHKFLQLKSITTNAGNLTTTLPPPPQSTKIPRRTELLFRQRAQGQNCRSGGRAHPGEGNSNIPVKYLSQFSLSNIPVKYPSQISLSNLFFGWGERLHSWKGFRGEEGDESSATRATFVTVEHWGITECVERNVGGEEVGRARGRYFSAGIHMRNLPLTLMLTPTVTLIIIVIITSN